MFIIQSETDLPGLQSAVHPRLYDAVVGWFHSLAEETGDCGARGLDTGSIRVLTASDAPCLNTLLATWPEYCELLTIGDGVYVWKVVVMPDNDCVETWFVPRGAFSDLDSWAQQYLDHDNLT